MGEAKISKIAASFERVAIAKGQIEASLDRIAASDLKIAAKRE